MFWMDNQRTSIWPVLQKQRDHWQITDTFGKLNLNYMDDKVGKCAFWGSRPLKLSNWAECGNGRNGWNLTQDLRRESKAVVVWRGFRRGSCLTRQRLTQTMKWHGALRERLNDSILEGRAGIFLKSHHPLHWNTAKCDVQDITVRAGTRELNKEGRALKYGAGGVARIHPLNSNGLQ